MMESSNVDDRTLHEIYVAPFLRSVMAGLTSVMCSYNLINGTYACENNRTINGILKNELGFQGFVTSDWYAQHSTISAMTGLDMSMPGDYPLGIQASYFGANLTACVRNKTVPEARLDDMTTRILASWYFIGQDSPNYPKTNFNAFFPLDETTNEHIDVQDDHGKLVREIDTSSIVLLKNVNGALPLKRPRKLALIGSDASPARIAGPNEFPRQDGVDGVLAVGWGSGYVHCVLRMSTMIRVSHRSHWDIVTHYSPTKFRYVFHLVVGKRVCTLFITRCLNGPYSHMRRSRRGPAETIRLFPGSSTTSTSLVPPQQLYNRTLRLCSCSPTRERASWSQWTAMWVTGRIPQVL
jgi:beta-glucosidase-like glycosyl hydrolase